VYFFCHLVRCKKDAYVPVHEDKVEGSNYLPMSSPILPLSVDSLGYLVFSTHADFDEYFKFLKTSTLSWNCPLGRW